MALAAATVVAFWPVTNAQFISLDDPLYVSQNLWVQGGLTTDSVKWAFTAFDSGLWHPLTWLSLMLDCELFGVNAAAMHCVNVGFQVANAVLLFLMLRRATHALWPSAVVAALFALHPLRVESVAWITERKDVLSTFFWILTIWTYAEYAQRRPPSAVVEGDAKANPTRLLRRTGRARWYIASLLLFALGLMSKAMLVTLPFVLLLLDVWPLRRIDVQTPRWWVQIRPLVIEKLPFFVLSVVSIVLTLLAAHHGEAMSSFAQLPVSERIENAIISYARYLGKTFWPTDLAVYYPRPGEWPALSVSAAAALLIVVTAIAVISVRSLPWFFVGWFWFVGTLVPVLGLIQAGGQSMADRFTYLPSVGLFIAIIWTSYELLPNYRSLKIAGLAVSLAIVVACAVMAHRQASYWENSETLFSHALRVTRPSVLVLNSLGTALLDQGRSEEAMQQFKAALKLNPKDSLAWGNIGNIYARDGKLDEAIEHYLTALRYNPGNVRVRARLAVLLTELGQTQDAIAHYRQALNRDRNNTLLFNNLAWILATHPDAMVRNGPEAVRLAERGVELTARKQPFLLGTLAAAYAEVGRFDEAVATAQEAIQLAEKHGQKERASKNRELLEHYRKGRPWREPLTNP